MQDASNLSGQQETPKSSQPFGFGSNNATAAPSKPADPFASLMSGGWQGSSGVGSSPVDNRSTNTSPMNVSPAFQTRSSANASPFTVPNSNNPPFTGPNSNNPPFVGPNSNTTSFQPRPAQPNTPQHQNNKPQPNYSRINIDPPAAAPAAPKPATATFEDLLGSQGFTFTSAKDNSAPKTMAQMKQAEMVKTMDPDRRKVCSESSLIYFL